MGANKYTALHHVTDTHKECTKCSKIKKHGEFHKDTSNIHTRGLCYYCKACANKSARASHARRKGTPEHKRKAREAYLQFTYGIGVDAVNQLRQAQGGKCPICCTTLKDGTYTHVDHDHDNGEIRGILCTNCNRGLGHFHDSINTLERAITYLRNYNESRN